MEKPKVLIVDDQVGINEYYGEFTNNSDYEIAIANSADAALKVMATNPPDIVVADLPKIDKEAKISDLATKFNTLLICAAQFSLVPDHYEVPDIARVLNKPFRFFDLRIAVRSELSKRIAV